MEQRQKEAPREWDRARMTRVQDHEELTRCGARTAEIQKAVFWLRNKSGMKTKTGILNGKRVDYFKGDLNDFIVSCYWTVQCS